MSLEQCTPKRCCKDKCGRDKCGEETKVSSLGYVIKATANAALVITEDNSLAWYRFFNTESKYEITDGDFVRVYKRKHGDCVKYASYFFSPKDIATAQVILDLGWQVQKRTLPDSEEADKLFLSPPCLEVKKQLEPAALE